MDIDATEIDATVVADAEHGRTVNHLAACCRQTCDNGVIDCSACLNEHWASLSASLLPEEMSLAELVLWIVGQAGSQGATKQTLVVCRSN